MDRPGRARVAAACGCALAVLLPFSVVVLPPSTDLPQHVAQLRLFHEWLADPNGPYAFQWSTPYGLVYAIGLALWQLLPPLEVGRALLAVLGLAWVGSIHLVAGWRQRSIAAAALTTPLYFSHVLYWGFVPFLLGPPLFLAWMRVVESPWEGRASWRSLLLHAFVGAALYWAHILWFAAAIGWLLLRGVHLRRFAQLGARMAALAPVLLATALWVPSLDERGLDSATNWGMTPTARLSFDWLTQATFGGIQGSLEGVTLLALLGWIALGTISRRESLRDDVDPLLLGAAAMFFAVGLLAPYKLQNTISFAERWVPLALALAVLAMPVPALRGRTRTGFVTGLVAVFGGATTLAWITFDERERAELPEVLELLPDDARVLGLVFAPRSDVLRGRPHLQSFAWAQVRRGATLNFSFAEFAQFPVVFRDRRHTWTPGLEWAPASVTDADLQQFEYVIVQGDEQVHARFVEAFAVRPVTTSGIWRLYSGRAPGTEAR